jgi:hypothetical protein
MLCVHLLKSLSELHDRDCKNIYFQLIISISTFKKKRENPSMSHLAIRMSFFALFLGVFI